MQLNIPKKTLIAILATLCLVLLSTGLYFFIKQDPLKLKLPKLDRYTDITEWCEYTMNDGILDVKCRALLLEIKNNENSDSCFELIVITGSKELKDLTICEDNNSVTYTNDVLGYKKLMPLDISFSYTKKGILNSYTFSSVSFVPMDEEYIHSIVNEDIANLVQTDVESVTTIKNSVNFCPRPEQLPVYVTEKNISDYNIFYYSSKLDESFFNDASLYDFSNDNLHIILGCESQIMSGYKSSCDSKTLKYSEEFVDVLSLLPMDINYDKDMNQVSTNTLKYLSAIFDEYSQLNYSNEVELLATFLKSLNIDTEINENLYCGIYKYLSKILNKDEGLNAYLSYLESYINNNHSKINSGMCLEAFSEEDNDMKGLYIKTYINNTKFNQPFSVFNRCINLSTYIN